MTMMMKMSFLMLWKGEFQQHHPQILLYQKLKYQMNWINSKEEQYYQQIKSLYLFLIFFLFISILFILKFTKYLFLNRWLIAKGKQASGTFSKITLENHYQELLFQLFLMNHYLCYKDVVKILNILIYWIQQLSYQTHKFFSFFLSFFFHFFSNLPSLSNIDTFFFPSKGKTCLCGSPSTFSIFNNNAENI